jgi:CRISPR-associated endoribonuclease Cas6
MPVEMRVEMYPEKDLVLPRFTGYVSRGLLLHMLKRVDPKLAQTLHEPEKMKPYSVTRLIFRSKARAPEGYILDSSYPLRVAFRFLDDAYARSLFGYFTEMTNVSIFDTTCRIASISIHSKDYKELEAEVQSLKGFSLVFESPTYLSSMGAPYHCLFPEPVRLLSNLMRLWSCFSTSRRFTKEEHGAYKDWLNKHVGVAEYELRTVLALMRKKKASGFLGWVAYEMDTDGDWNRVTSILARFAEFSNVGGNRTGGFGETRFRPTAD